MWKSSMLCVDRTRRGGECATRLYAPLAYKTRYVFWVSLTRQEQQTAGLLCFCFSVFLFFCSFC